MKKDLLIGIDASTTACKAVVWDCHGKQIASSRREIPLLRPQADWYEQRAEDIHTAMFEALRIIDQLVDTTRLAGICICPQRETFITVDVNGNPLRNAILWMDNRARDWLPDLEWNLGRDNFLNLTGKPPSGNLTTLKLRWLREMEEDVFRHGYKFLDVAAFLNHTLTGKFATGWGIADPTGLFDMKAKCWSEQVMRYLQISPERLPLAYPTGTHIGDISVAASRKTGLQAGLPVFAGLGDGQAGGLALNILQPGACYLSLGTSVVSGTYSCDFLTSRNFRTMFAGNHDGYSLESVILGGTYTIDWFLDYFAKGCSIAALEKEIGKLPPGAEGLILVPYWNSVLNP